MKPIVVFLVFNFLAVAMAASAKDRKVEPGLAELVARIDQKIETVGALKADFVQRKEISLLTEPVEMRGVFYIKRPEGMRFDFEEKEDLQIIMTEDEAVSLSPAAKKATRIKMKKSHGKIAQRLLSNPLKSLLNHFSIGRVEKESEDGTHHHLQLTPTKRKLKKRFKKIEFWVNGDSLIYRIKVTQGDGDIYELILENFEINPELDADLFTVNIPENYQLGDRMEFIFGAGEML